MKTQELSEPVHWEAVAALKFAAEKDGLSLHAVNVDLIASIVARRSILAAMSAGEIVSKDQHDTEVDRLMRRADQFSHSWASVQVSADQQMRRAQSALSELEDRDLAQRLAGQIGVILFDEPETLFEPAV